MAIAYIKTMMTIIVFLILSSWFLAEMTGSSYILLNPVTWAIIGIELAAVIVAPVGVLGIGNLVRTVAIGVLFGTMVLTFFVDMLYNSMPMLWGVVIVPIYFALGFMMIEVGKG